MNCQRLKTDSVFMSLNKNELYDTSNYLKLIKNEEN